MHAFRHVLVAVDFGASSERALELSIQLVEGGDAKLTLVHVVEIVPFAYAGMSFSVVDLIGPIEDAARTQLDRLLDAVRVRIPAAEGVLRRGYASTDVIDTAQQRHADVIVVGTHGRGGLSHAFLGSVAEKIVRHSTVPVLTVRGERPL